MKGGKNVQPKIRIETDETAQTEVIIRCNSLTPEIQQLVRLLEGLLRELAAEPWHQEGAPAPA